jgi:hypothetical protein
VGAIHECNNRTNGRSHANGHKDVLCTNRCVAHQKSIFVIFSDPNIVLIVICSCTPCSVLFCQPRVNPHQRSSSTCNRHTQIAESKTGAHSGVCTVCQSHFGRSSVYLKYQTAKYWYNFDEERYHAKCRWRNYDRHWFIIERKIMLWCFTVSEVAHWGLRGPAILAAVNYLSLSASSGSVGSTFPITWLILIRIDNLQVHPT